MDRQSVLVAMSGGVDSSVAAYLLIGEGYSVSGAMMRLFSGPSVGLPEDTLLRLGWIFRFWILKTSFGGR